MDRKELIRNAVLSVRPEDIKRENMNTYPNQVIKSSKCKPKQISNAIALYAKDCRPENVAVLVDLAILNSGKKGYLFAEDGFYADKSQLIEEPFKKQRIPIPIRYEELEKVSIDEKREYLTFQYKDGKSIRVFGNIYTDFLYRVFSAIINALKETDAPAPDGDGDSESGKCAQEVRMEEAAAEEEGRLEDSDVQKEYRGQTEEKATGDAKEKNALPDTPEGRYAARKRESAEVLEALRGQAKKEEEARDRIARQQREEEAGKRKEFVGWERAAAKGDPEAQYRCGMAYLEGTGTYKDEKKALHWIEKAAKQEYAEAQYQLAVMSRDKARLDWMEKSAMHDYGKAQQFLGKMYLNGEQGVEKDISRGVFWLRQSVANGFDEPVTKGLIREGLRYVLECNLKNINVVTSGEERDTKNLYSSRKYYAEAGRPVSQYRYGFMLENGNGVPKDGEKALDMFEKAAKQGYAPAQYECGRMYQQGWVTAANPEKACLLYEKAASQGYAKAQYELGRMYEEGKCVPQDGEKALQLYERAAEQGHKEAAERMDSLELRVPKAKTLREKEKVPEKETWAEAEERRRAMARETEDLLNKALAYYDGDGVEKNEDEAIKLFRECAMRDHARAQYALGVIYNRTDSYRSLFWLKQAQENGFTTDEGDRVIRGISYNIVLMDREETLETQKDRDELCRARGVYAEKGYVVSQYQCGKMYEKMYDNALALSWYEKAANQGHAEAQYLCGEMYRKGKGTAPDPVKALYWYEGAADRGDARAQYQCGLMYEAGEGCKADRGKALEWYRKASLQGNEEAGRRYESLEMPDTSGGDKAKEDGIAVVCSAAPFMRGMYKSMLTKEGIGAVYDAGCDGEGMERCRKLKPDLVFLDFRADGEAFVKELAQTCPDTKVILCADVFFRLAEELGLQYVSTVLGTLAKPIQEKALKELIGKVFPS